MKLETKIWLRRFTLRWLRKLVDVVDDRLHAAEVRFRKTIENQGAPSLEAKLAAKSRRVGPLTASPAVCEVAAEPSEKESAVGQTCRRAHLETFSEWEMRRAGVAPISKKAARRHRERVTAANFDLRYAR